MPSRTLPNGSAPSSDEHGRRADIDGESRIPNRLILCFDGTGNSFQGTPGDTNIVKLLDMFNRSAPRQLHYYQPGIGTYTADGAVNLSLFGRIKKSISQTIDSGLATSFESHVIAGYRFLMRYYGPGDRIYIFGFSRGAFTARFLARMISHVGLLSMGNEEMVPFAYKVYQDYEMGLDGAYEYMKVFRSTFCRHEKKAPDVSGSEYNGIDVEEISEDDDEEEGHDSQDDDGGMGSKMVDTGIKVHFLGLFDTVSSIRSFDVPFTKTVRIPQTRGTAEHVRHAVAIDERRVKFKAALLAQDKQHHESQGEDNKEVWFPGNHGDIGGGWYPEEEKPLSWWQRIRKAWGPSSTPAASGAHLIKKGDEFQLSDIALKWMVDELDNLPENTDHVLWNKQKKRSFMKRFAEKRSDAIKGFMHDTMTFGRGSEFGKTIMWKLMEYLPFVRRWEYEGSAWKYTSFPLNKGDTRDIPHEALLHHSVLERMQLSTTTYRPKNKASIGGEAMPLSDALLRASKNGTKQRGNDVYLQYATGKEVKNTDSLFSIINEASKQKVTL